VKKPNLVGRIAQAWQLGLKPRTPDQTATIGAWLVQGPFHPFWDRWGIIMIHLRDIPDVRPPNKQFKGATHEFIIMSVDPEMPREINIEDPQFSFVNKAGKRQTAWLSPPDVVCQVKLPSDAEALRILRTAVDRIILNGWSPDSDFRRDWQEQIKALALAAANTKNH
jgi:hypothetical protein